MKKLSLLRASALHSAAFVGLVVGLAPQAFAQDAPAASSGQEQNGATRTDCPPGSTAQSRPECTPLPDQAPASEQAASSEESIVVTGTRIRRPNLESPVPVTSVMQAELPSQGQANIGDQLNDLPSLRSTFSQQNSGRFIGTAGQNFLDLRGLGTTRTLVLVNQRRHITASPGDFIVDVNTIPTDLIERIDIVTGGESAVYGSDAIAGVVNFVLKRDFDGIRVRGQGGISTRGDRGIDFVSMTAGQNFAGGRGNIAVNLEYLQANPLYVKDRPHYRASCGFDQVDDTSDEGPGTPNPTNSDNIPDNDFLCGIQVPGVTAGGAIGSLAAGTLAFDPAGNLVVTAPDRVLLSGDVLSTNPLVGTPLNERDQLDVGQRRYTANLLAHFDISDAFRPFIEAKFVHQRVRQEGQPTFFTGSVRNFFLGNFGFPVPNLLCGNPFLSAQAQNVLTNTVSTCARRNANGTIALDASGRRIFDPTRILPLNRFNVDFGGRGEIDKRDTYRIVGGIEGNFNQDWHYELSVNYGHFKSNYAQLNNLFFADINGNPAGFALAIDAVRNGAGQIVCRVNADADPTNDSPGCVPINLFGQGAPSPEALAFVNTTSHLYSRASELDVLAFVSGDSSQLFELPGGPVGFSIGAEYRRETAHSTADPLSQTGATFFNVVSEFKPPALEVKEVFAELNVPLLRNRRFFKELSVSGAARYSDYNTSANKTFAWNVSGIYAPTSDLRFRANYSRSVRAPTPTDLFSPASQDFAFIDDPCDVTNIGTGNNRANCAAFKVPTTVLPGSPCIGLPTPGTNVPIQAGDPFRNCITNGSPRQSIQFLSAGNPNLREEEGKSLTVGGVLTPRFIPGLSLTVDYFNIKVTNLIATLGAQAIVNQCFSQPNINNQFCTLLNPRDQFGLFASPAGLTSGVNFAKQTSRGIDVDLSYRHSFSSDLRLSVRGIATYTLERNNFTDPSNAQFADRQLSELGDPVFSGSLITGLDIGKFNLQYTLRYIGTMTIFAYETTNSVQGRAPTDPDIATHLRYPQVFYHDVRLETKVSNRFRFYLGVDNVFDRLPPFGLTGTGGGGAIYNNLGRFVYAGAQVDF